MSKSGPKKSGTRHKARMRAVELIFEAEAKDIAYGELLSERDEQAGGDDTVRPVLDYARNLIGLLGEQQKGIDEKITSHLTDWELPRLPAVDRAILRLAVAEMFYQPDVQIVIVVDEAVSLAKELSTDSSPAFINGVLGKLIEEATTLRADLLAAVSPQVALSDTVVPEEF